LDMENMLFDDMLVGAQQGETVGDLWTGTANSDVDKLFATFMQGVKEPFPESACPSLLPEEPREYAADEDEDEEEDDAAEDEDGEEDGVQEGVRGSPTMEQVASWEGEVVEVERDRPWKDHTTGVLQSRCFAVEWRGSVLLDRKDFVRRLFRVVGGDASFVLGVDKRTSRADYMVVVRVNSRFRKKDWRKILMFGHGNCHEEEGLYMRVRVPRRAKSEDGGNTFVREMLRKCETYCLTCQYKQEGLIREQGRGQSRSGSKAKRKREG